MAWSHRQTEIDGRPSLVLIDDSYRDAAPINELPKIAWFGVYFRLDPGPSFWDPDEDEALHAIEKDLLQLCGQFGNGCAAYVMCIDTRGMREYYIYYGDGAALENVLPNLKAEHPDYRIEFDHTTDSQWKRYTTFLPETP